MKPSYYYNLALGIAYAIITASSALVAPPPTRTLVTYISVINGAGRLSPGYEVRGMEHGSCEYGSPALESSPIPVYMCATDRSTYLTCWYLAPTKPNSAIAVCLPLPWSKYVTEVSTTAVPVTPVHAGTSTNLNWPWAVQLTTGKRCLPGPGPGQVISGLGIVDYYCGGPAFGLLDHANRDHSLWTFKSVRESLSGKYALAGQVAVGRAWFAGPAARSK